MGALASRGNIRSWRCLGSGLRLPGRRRRSRFGPLCAFKSRFRGPKRFGTVAGLSGAAGRCTAAPPGPRLRAGLPDPGAVQSGVPGGPEPVGKRGTCGALKAPGDRTFWRRRGSRERAQRRVGRCLGQVDRARETSKRSDTRKKPRKALACGLTRVAVRSA